MTKLEERVGKLSRGVLVQNDMSQKEKQKILDEITPAVVQGLEATDIVRHSNEVYSATAHEYEKNPHTKEIVDELLQFMDMLPLGARVLDVGCGVGRDSLFLSVEDEEYRRTYMGRLKDGLPTRDRIFVPKKTFEVTAIDNSLEMLMVARKKSDLLIEEGLLNLKTAPVFCVEDMHYINDPAFPGGYKNFDGVWSCTALFTCTPAQMLEPAMESVSKVLQSGGVFFVSYTNGGVSGQYDKLLASSTGRIKYFSHPNPEEIIRLANRYKMTLKSQAYSNFEIQGKVIQENLFVSQFFRKT